jgi:sulfoxide reductase heme-binding subunit YedZ
VHLVWRLFTDRLGANPIEELQLETGIWALRFLAITLAVTPLRRLTGWSGIVRYRRLLGLVAFFYVCLHLVNYLAIDLQFDMGNIVEDVAERLYITVGMAAFLLLLPLAVTSTRGWQRRLGRRWQRLHRLAYAAAVLGTVHFLWAVKKDITEPLAYAAIFATLFAVRLWFALAPRLRGLRARTAPSPSRDVAAGS